MTTTAIPLGRLSRLQYGTQSAFGTAAPSGYKTLHYYRQSLRAQQPKAVDNLLGGGFQNDRDSLPSAPGLIEHGGDVEVPLCGNQIGWWCRAAFGAPSTTGTTNYTHAFNSGATTMPSHTLEVAPQQGASDFRQHIGCVMRSFRLQIAPAEGFHRATLGFAGRTETLLTSTGAGTPSTVALDQYAAARGTLLLGGSTLGQVLSADITYETGVEMERYADDIEVVSAAILSRYATIRGTFRLRYTGQTVDNLAIADTAQSVEFLWTKGVNNSLSVLVPRCKLERSGVQIDGPGGIEQAFTFIGEVQAGTRMTTWTLKNQIASYA